MPMLTRDAALNGKSRMKIQKVPVPEWWEEGSFVYVRGLPADAGKEVQELCASKVNETVDEGLMMIGWCVLGICDKQGMRVYTSDDITALRLAPLMAIQRCATAVMELNGVTEEAAKERRKKSRRTGKKVRV